jgi:DNA replication protein DnaC
MRTVAPAESWNALQPRAFAAPLVVLSDLGTESPSAWHRSQLAQIINQRHDDRLPVIVTTNLQPGQMTGQIGSLEFYGDRAWDRLRGGIDVECVGPSLREVLK